MLADEFQKLFDEVDKGVIKEVSRPGLCHLPSLSHQGQLGFHFSMFLMTTVRNPQPLGLAVEIWQFGVNLLPGDIYYWGWGGLGEPDT